MSIKIKVNNTIAKNTGTGDFCPGGIFIGYSSLTITNNIIASNIASGTYHVGGIFCWNSSPMINYNDVWNVPYVDYRSCGAGPNDISQDPLFKDPINGDYHLQSGSRCIDAGNDSAPEIQLTDIEGNPRIIDVDPADTDAGAVDMGAYEFDPLANRAPVTVDDGYSVDEDDTLAVDAPGVLENDSDPDEDDITAVLVDDVSHGDLTLNVDGSFTYTSDENFKGTDSFTYKAFDDELESEVAATVSITINEVNDPPVAADNDYAVDEDDILTIDAPGVLDNDNDVDDDSLRAVLVDDVSQGSLTLYDDGSFTYEPAADFNGTDRFTYMANDDELDSEVATVNITVNAVNDPPVADELAETTDEDTPVEITLTGSDVDEDGLTFSVVEGPSDGTLSGTAPDLTYSPNPDFYGTDSFTYMASDAETDSNVATVIIDVIAVNDPPEADDQSVATNEDTAVDITLTASDVDSSELTYSIETGPLFIRIWFLSLPRFTLIFNQFQPADIHNHVYYSKNLRAIKEELLKRVE